MARLGDRRLQLERAVVVGTGFSKPALLEGDVGAADQAFGEVRIEFERAVDARLGLREPAELLQHQPAVTVGRRVLGVELDHLVVVAQSLG